jgi:hypothetical protein
MALAAEESFSSPAPDPSNKSGICPVLECRRVHYAGVIIDVASVLPGDLLRASWKAEQEAM